MRAMATVFSMRRTWALLLAFCLLVLLKSSAKFASIYAKVKLGLSPADATGLFTTYAVASACSGLFGGIAYDVVPGGKVGIGLLMTALNLLNLSGFVYAFIIESRGLVDMYNLQVFMSIVGFAGVLPVSLPFQIYAMAIGGVPHCGMLVATFEGSAMVVEALLDLVIGSLLEQEDFTTWLGVNVALACSGTAFMALFFLLDYRKAPKAPALTAVPSMNFLTRNNSQLQLWMESFAKETPPHTPPRSPMVGRRNSPPKQPGGGGRLCSEPSRHSHGMSTSASGLSLRSVGEDEAEIGEEDEEAADDAMTFRNPSAPMSPVSGLDGGVGVRGVPPSDAAPRSERRPSRDLSAG